MWFLHKSFSVVICKLKISGMHGQHGLKVLKVTCSRGEQIRLRKCLVFLVFCQRVFFCCVLIQISCHCETWWNGRSKHREITALLVKVKTLFSSRWNGLIWTIFKTLFMHLLWSHFVLDTKTEISPIEILTSTTVSRMHNEGQCISSNDIISGRFMVPQALPTAPGEPEGNHHNILNKHQQPVQYVQQKRHGVQGVKEIENHGACCKQRHHHPTDSTTTLIFLFVWSKTFHHKDNGNLSNNETPEPVRLIPCKQSQGQDSRTECQNIPDHVNCHIFCSPLLFLVFQIHAELSPGDQTQA